MACAGPCHLTGCQMHHATRACTTHETATQPVQSGLRKYHPTVRCTA
jgi:hypothetical protein